jgi:hypothetical protein
MSDAVNEAELGRSKYSTTPKEHLYHLLTIGWEPNSPLIIKYVSENGLTKDLNDWLALNKSAATSK